VIFGVWYRKRIIDKEIKEKLNMNINKIKLNEKDENKLQESLRMVEKLPFVEKIEFEETSSTILVRLSQMNKDTEKKIYQIEYNLMQNFDEYVNFIVLPI
jgi:hypothetical protein